MPRNICLVGAGFISGAHASAIKLDPTLALHSVVDPNSRAAKALANAFHIPEIYSSIEDAISAGSIDRAHILTPPDTHASSALSMLEAGIPVLVEKPFAVSTMECSRLTEKSNELKVIIGVNQNFVHHPAFLQLLKSTREGRIGRLQFASCIYNVPLRQLKARQFGHWMFAEPKNILLEQVVHPLSQLIALAGPITELRAKAHEPIEISPSVPFYPSVSVICHAALLPFEMHVNLGAAFPFWQVTTVGDDGVATADIFNNRYYTFERTRWLEPLDQMLSGLTTARSTKRQSISNFLNYALSILRLRPPSDGFSQSMRNSITAFHRALDTGLKPECDGAFGEQTVRACERIAEAAFEVPRSSRLPKRVGQYEIAIIGGTGFIGRHLVKRLSVKENKRVGVMARNIRNLPPEFFHENVVVTRGDMTDDNDIQRFIENANIVIGLAHGGGGKSYSDIHRSMVGGAESIARICMSTGCKRLIHIGSIASLYLGPHQRQITGATLPDSQFRKRADYARAKAECDLLLLEMHVKDNLPVTILRPGIVLGEGASPFHSGFGFFNNEQHCMGWNAGDNPLPLVLVEDVAAAIALACFAPNIDGRTFNLVGDVRMSAQEYISILGQILCRNLYFYPHEPNLLWLAELFNWGIKKAGGRDVPLPSRRDILSRGLVAEFDCSDIKTTLGWHPESDRDRFISRSMRVHLP